MPLASDFVALKAALQNCQTDVNKYLATLLPESSDTVLYAPVLNAMRYGVTIGGKRLRPFLVQLSCDICGVESDAALKIGAALELLHTYSLIHDDLPAMDDSDQRRGQPSCHKQFDDATAILAGDALLTYVFEHIAEIEMIEGAARLRLITALAKAAGKDGMVGGQMIDIWAEQQNSLTLAQITQLQALKTGALFEFACQVGPLIQGEAAAAEAKLLQTYAEHFGLLFQITDDILDIEGDEALTGKPLGQDDDKITFVTLLGLDGAKAKADEHVTACIDAAKQLGDKANLLLGLANYVRARQA